MDYKKEGQLFKKAVSHVSQHDINEIRNKLPLSHLSNIQIAYWVIWDRWVKKECDVCKKKAIERCTKCWYPWYCSKNCQEVHASSHKFRCCENRSPELVDPSIHSWINTQCKLEEKSDQDQVDQVDFMKLKDEIQDIFKNETKLAQFLANCETNKYFQGHWLQTVPLGKIVVLVFPTLQAIYNTYYNQCDLQRDQCIYQLIDKNQALSFFSEATILQNFNEQKHYGLLIASLLGISNQKGQMVVHCLYFYEKQNEDVNKGRLVLEEGQKVKEGE